MITSQQIKALVRKKSKLLNLNANIILRAVIFELFLEKLSKSPYKDKFIVKGGFLISAITKIDLRTTMDLDITLKSLSIEQSALKKCIEEIILIPTHNELIMEFDRIVEIHDEADYPGLRVSLRIFFQGIKGTIKIDFTTGDILTPSETHFNYLTILQGNTIELMSYNIETILAEKIERILSRGVLNTRMRDFYDVYILWKLKRNEIDSNILQNAIIKTSKYRKTYDSIIPKYRTIIELIEADSFLIKMWETYQINYPFANDIVWEDIIMSIKMILKETIK